MNSCLKHPPELRRARPLLGTIVEITARGSSTNSLAVAIDTAFRAIENIQFLLSYHDPSSELSQLNREALSRVVTVSQPTRQVLLLARRIHAASGGSFDPVIAPFSEQTRNLPRPTRARRGPDRARFSDVIFESDNGVRFARSLRIDLGGVAKGFAVDRAIEALQRADVAAGLVNAGGDLRAFGGNDWPIVVRDPVVPGRLRSLGNIRDGALATSAVYFSRRRTAAGRWTSAILDPHSGRPWLAHASVTVQAADAAVADALTKVVALKGCIGSKAILETFGAQSGWLSRDGGMQSTGKTACAA